MTDLYTLTLQDLFDAYHEACDHDCEESEKVETEVLKALPPLAYELLSKMPRGKKFIKRVALRIKDEKKFDAKNLVEAKAAGFQTYKEFDTAKWKAKEHERRSAAAVKAAATRAKRRKWSEERAARVAAGELVG